MTCRQTLPRFQLHFYNSSSWMRKILHKNTYGGHVPIPPICHTEVLWGDTLHVPAWLEITSLRNCFHYDESTSTCWCRKSLRSTWTTWVMVNVYHTRTDWFKNKDEWRTGHVSFPITGSNSRPHQIKSKWMPKRLFNFLAPEFYI
jgi:hypothetical protein